MWHSPVNCCSESVAPVGGDVAPSQAAAVDPASDGVVLLACMTNKLELNHECVRSCVLFARPNVVACGRRTRNEWNTPSQPVAHLKKKEKRLSSHMLAAFLFCVGRRRHGRLKGQKVNLREFETSAAFVMNVSGRCLPKTLARSMPETKCSLHASLYCT